MKWIIVWTMLIYISFPIVGQHKNIAHIYLDTVTKNFVAELKNRHVDDYVIYTEIYFPRFPEKAGDTVSNKTCYIFWKEKNRGYVKKISSNYFSNNKSQFEIFCLEFRKIQVNTDTIAGLIATQHDKLIKEDKYDKEAINKLYYKSYFRFDGNVEEIFAVIKNDSLYFYSCSPYHNNYQAREKVILLIKNVLLSHGKKYVLSNKTIADSSFINHCLATDKAYEAKINEYRTHLMNEWIRTSVPITEEELKKLPVLEQKVYELYEELMRRDTFLCGESINDKVKYFVVPRINIGIYSVIENNYPVMKEIRPMKNFRPRCNQKAEKFLYMNSDIETYYEHYDEYGCLPGVYHTNSILMSGYMSFIESPPAVGCIYFNETFTEAYIIYNYSSRTYECTLKKENNQWKYINILSVVESD